MEPRVHDAGAAAGVRPDPRPGPPDYRNSTGKGTAVTRSIVSVLIVLALAPAPASACTNLLVTRGASVDGSVMITYTCDGEFHPRLSHTPAADHAPDAMLEIRDWSGELRGAIPQAPHTYAVTRLQNEHQLVIAETTFDGRPELRNPDGLLHYWELMTITLQRARTAREAIAVMTGLVAEHGYRSTGESFSLGDTDEAWILEMIGTGPGGDGALWVARRVPDGMISAHANMARIGVFPLDDPENCLYEPRVADFAAERGWYDPEGGEPFSFRKAYAPVTPQTLRYTATRVWSLFRRAAPSLDLSPDFHRAAPGAEPYPLWVRPDEKLDLADVIALMRDHYEGTPFDMTQGVDAGPFGSPNRWRPMTWRDDGGAVHSWERPISTQQTGFSFVAQCRGRLPDPIGGVLWYGVDDTYTTCYFPLYCGVDDVPSSFAVGSLDEFSWDSAWWVFNFVANFANLKYSHMIRDIQAVRSGLEDEMIARQPAVEQAALALADDRERLRRYLTDYSVSCGETVTRRWLRLGEDLIRKYNDGYVQREPGRAEEVGYPRAWLRDVEALRPGRFMLPAGGDTIQTVLPY